MSTEKKPAKRSTAKEPEGTGAKKRPTGRRYEQERAQFRALILANPNYFGNVKESPFKPVLNIQSNTTYEEICGVGYQPQFNRLEAVVFVNQASGYGGDICSPGTPEYLRFYLSFDDGATWHDQGLAAFTAYNIAGDKPLEYAVTLEIDPSKKFCFINNLVLVRVILSWNVPPPPDEPDYPPVWGNVHDTRIQIDPFKWIVIDDIFKALELEIPPEMSASLDTTQSISAAKPKVLSAMELKELYEGKVEPHRFALSEVHKLMSQPTSIESLMAAGSEGVLAGLGIDLTDVLDKLFPVDGDTSYEELECVGLNPNNDTLVGAIRVKLPSGYSGDLCTAGSKEYVTFWADFDEDGTFTTCLGTSSVTVYDIDNIPEEGLEYAVFLPVDLSSHRQPCEDGPKVVKIRAILSWQDPAPCWNPDHIPIWGNREETLIHIKPGFAPQPGTYPPIIQTVGSMDVDDINTGNGLANGPAALAGFNAVDSPFGGWVIVTGHIGNPPDISSGATKLKYRVEVSGNGGFSWEKVTNPFTLGRDQLLDGVWSDLPAVPQAVDGDDYYEHQEDLTDGPGNAQIFPVGNVLARWATGGLTGLWMIRIRAKNPDIGDPPTWTSNVVTVRLDDKAPTGGAADPDRPSIVITSGGGACADFLIGDVISGDYEVSDEHFGSLTFRVLPTLGGAFTSPPPLPAGPTTMPLTRTYAGGVPKTGEAGVWSLNTAGMPRCGYIVELSARDRTIINSGSVGRHRRGVVGLCLREEGE